MAQLDAAFQHFRGFLEQQTNPSEPLLELKCVVSRPGHSCVSTVDASTH